MKQTFTTLGIILFSFLAVQAQYLTYTNEVPDAISTCEDYNFKIEFTNTFGAKIRNVYIHLELPDNVVYTGDLSNGSNYPAYEYYVENSHSVWFWIHQVPKDKVVSFTYSASALEASDDGSGESNNLTVFFQTNQTNGSGNYYIDEVSTPSYDATVAELTITSINPMNSTEVSGATFERSIVVENTGSEKIGYFQIRDFNNNNLDVVAVDLGQLNNSGNRITLDSDDFSQVGNGNGTFDPGETLTVTETIKVKGCSAVSSEIFTKFHCNGTSFYSNVLYPYTEVSQEAPQLSVVPSPSFNTCTAAGADQQELQITNSGSSTAKNLILDLFQHRGNGFDDTFSKIDINHIQYKINNGSYQHILPWWVYHTDCEGPYACLGYDAWGRFIMGLPNLAPGDVLSLKWDTYTCDTDFCGRVDLIGWKYDLYYQNSCNYDEFVTSGTGQEAKGKDFVAIAEYDTDINDGQIGNFTLNFPTAKLDLPSSASTEILLEVNIPGELYFAGAQSALSFKKGNETWTPTIVDFNNGLLEVTYPYPAPFDLTDASLNLELALDCSSTSPAITDGSVDVDFQLTYLMEADCEDTYRMPLVCETLTTNLHCDGVCAKGMTFEGFTVERLTLGEADNDHDRLPDNSGSLDESQIKLKRAVPGDEITTVFAGTVKTSWLTPEFAFGQAQSIITNGQVLTPQSASLWVWDASTGNTLEASNVPFTTSSGADQQTVEFDFSINSLLTAGNMAFNGFTFANGDLVELRPVYQVTENIGAASVNLNFANTFELSESPNGTAYGCGEQGDVLSVIGYAFTAQGSANYEVDNCALSITQGFNLFVGNQNSEVDYFPAEYRALALANTAEIQLPTGYNINNVFLRHYRPGSNGSEIEEIFPLAATPQGSGTFQIDFSNVYVANGGAVNPADQGFKGQIYLDLDTDCQSATGESEIIDWSFNFTDLGNPSSDASIEVIDSIEHQLAELQMLVAAESIEGIEKTETWQLTLQNNSPMTTANFAWLIIENDHDDLTIEKVYDQTTNLEVFPENGVFKLGNIANGTPHNLEIEATYTSCETRAIIAHYGFSCGDYPTNLDAAECSADARTLSLQPQSASFTASLDSRTTDDADLTFNSVDLIVQNTDKAFLSSVSVTVETPGTERLQLLDGQTVLEYPLGATGEIITTPTASGNLYLFEEEDLHADLGKQGLPGTTEVAASAFHLKFDVGIMNNFASGDRLKITVAATSVCGEVLEPQVFFYDPNHLFGQVTDNGINGGENNWGVSWADYDRDGDPDLFVTNYDVDKPNSLYNNQGDGTFVRITEGPIGTDMANSIGSSWGDYDNDGDFDLYVTNTIGFKNFLYRNEGDGSFIRIMDDPAVNYNQYSHGVSWVDYDNDGFLDLFITDFFATKFNLLYHNNGDGTFTQNNTSALVLDAGSSASGVWADYDNDGDMDVFVVNTNDENNWLYRNDGNGNFTKITEGDIVNDGGKSVGASWGDIDNDGDFDLFVANAGNQNNFLYMNNGDGTFSKNTENALTQDNGNSHGSSFGDYDNDGDLDLAVTNDANQDNFFYVNDGEGNFSAIDNGFTKSGGQSFGVAWADYDNDGDLDLYVVNHSHTDNFFFRNDRDINKDILNYNQACISLEGSLSNDLGLGARVSILANIFGQDVWQVREVNGQTGGGLSAQNDIRQFFGLGDAPQIDSVVIEWPSGLVQSFGPQVANDCLDFVEQGGAVVCGTAYYDENGDCQYNSGETFLANAAITVQPGNQTVFTDENGEYTISLAAGNYTLNQGYLNNWAGNCTNNSQSVSITNVGTNYCGFDFAYEPSTGLLQPDLEVALSSTALRIGFESLYAISFANAGTAAATNTTLAVDFGSYIVPLQSSLPWDSISGTTYFWNLGTVDFGSLQTIYVYDSISTAAVIGDFANVSATIEATETDLDITDNTTTDNPEFVGAFDPNDILVFPEGAIEPEEVLSYKIRFQNVGNAEVEQVIIRNTLSEELDLESIELGTASHAHRFFIEDDRTLVWQFDNIYLPDSTTDEAASHGFVTYRIKPLADLDPGTTITNQAEIYFDRNEPIITNTTVNSIRVPRNGVGGTLTIFPNPLSADYATIEINPKGNPEENVTIQRIFISDALGRTLVREERLDVSIFYLDRNLLTAGYYVISILGSDGNEYVGKLIAN